MNRIYKLLLIIIYFVSILQGTTILAGDEKSGEMIQKLKSKYDKLKTLQADFVQIAYWKLADNSHEQKGSIWLKGTEKFKIETQDQAITANGTTLWTFSGFNQQVIIENMTKSKDVSLPRDLFLTYSEQYQSSYIGEELVDNDNCHVIYLTGKTDDLFIKTIKIWISMKLWMPVKIEQQDLNSNKNTYLLKNIQLDEPIPDAFFNYTLPDSVEIIDMR
ncbi:MAG TPA: outer membrane lipoprotein carrier protein LolA [bacterium]